ncbi:TOPRIM nucleotidyl transferase/hydrolase domain-containing protein [Exiguobacterium sp. s133]|uniref:TOPRIM nucleotidyl transferase/hydrolase domain-containing protein n=1 Tax=Exiguobacterium sp. s133 TaxID=2751213 RepID=UPI001BE5ECFC|nr:TOPRIM nucleotidyl transferase/hydrolase domain-containing protein [Exiguobacterium sp. s133]
MDLNFFVGSNGAGKTFTLRQFFEENNHSVFINEEGHPSFKITKPNVRIDFESGIYYFQDESRRGEQPEESQQERISSAFLPLLKEISILKRKLSLITLKSKGQEKFSNLLNIFTEYNFNNIKCICLDEPENFLDEDYIKEVSRIIVMLSKIGLKVKVATHSTRILIECNATMNKIFIVNRSGHHYINFEGIREMMRETTTNIRSFESRDFTIGAYMLNKLNAYQNEEYLRVLVSQLIESEEFFRCLFNKTIVLVEGASEIIALNTIKNRFPTSTQVFTAHGKVYMPFFVKLLNYLGKNVIVVIDTDQDARHSLPRAITSYFNNEKEVNNLNLVLHDPDLEGHYGIPWREISSRLGYRSDQLNGDLKSIVSMIFFNQSDNQDRLFDKIQLSCSQEETSYDFT